MPIPVKTRPKFKCQFCLSYRATLKAVERHEGFCWQNPNRFCKTCENTDIVKFDLQGAGGHYGEMEQRCPYCSKEDKTITESLRR